MENSNKIPIFPPYLGVTIGIFAVSSASIFIKFAQLEVASIVIAAYRLGLATLLLAPLIIVRHKGKIKALPKSMKLLGVVSGVLLAVHFSAWIKSLEFTTVTSSVVLVTTTPLWVAMAAPFTLKEKITKAVWAGLVLALFGTVVIGLGDICLQEDGSVMCPALVSIFQGKAVIGDVLAVIGAWGAAGYVIIGRKLRSKLDVAPYIFLVYGVAAIVLLGMMLLSGEKMIGFSNHTTIILVLLAVVPQLIGHTTFNWALGFLPAAIVSISLLGEPIGSTILAFIVLDETPNTIQVLGTVLIFSGILIASNSKREIKLIENDAGSIEILHE